MRDALWAALVALGAFVGTNVDDFFAFAAQLALTEPSRHRRAVRGQVVGEVLLIAVAAGASGALVGFSIRDVGVLALVPLALAVRAWRHRHDESRDVRRGAITTALVTVSMGGDNVAVWTPLFRADGVAHGVLAGVVFVVADLVLVALAVVVARRPRVVAFGRRWSPRLLPALYVALAVVVAAECHVF